MRLNPFFQVTLHLPSNRPQENHERRLKWTILVLKCQQKLTILVFRSMLPSSRKSNLEQSAVVEASTSSSVLIPSLELSDTKVYAPQIRTLLGIAAHFCTVVVVWGASAGHRMSLEGCQHPCGQRRLRRSHPDAYL